MKNKIICIGFILGSMIFSQYCSPPKPQSDQAKFHTVKKNPMLLVAQKPTQSNLPIRIKENIEYIESMPFDGMFVNTANSQQVMNGRPLSYNSIYDELSVLNNTFKKFRYNFLSVFIHFPGDLWDDRVWEITAQNFAKMAKAAKAVGFRGIVYDNEEIEGKKWLNYNDENRNPNYDLLQHRDQSILRGKEVMEAMVTEFPELELIICNGPYLSEPNYRTPGIIFEQAASWDNYELLGPFFVGMMLSEGANSSIIDGGKIFQYRTKKDFKNSYDVRKYEIASEETDSWFIPYKLRLIWPNRLNIAFGVYNRQWKPAYPMNPEIMRTTLKNALTVTDKYVWYYTEEDDWLKPGKIANEWIKMVEEVRREIKDSLNNQ